MYFKLIPKLFQPDIFSQTKPILSPVSDDIYLEVQNAYSSMFDEKFGIIEKIEKYGGIEVNTNNFNVTTVNGLILMKRVQSSSEKLKEFSRIIDCARYLKQSGCPVPNFLSYRSDQVLYEGCNGFFWVTMNVMSGDHSLSGFDVPQNLGLEIGKLYRTLKTAPPEFKPLKKWLYCTPKDSENYQTLLQDSVVIYDKFSKEHYDLFQENKDFVEKSWKECVSKKEELINEKNDIVHGDLHPHNILMKNCKLSAFLDLESIVSAPLNVGIAFSTFKLLRQYIVEEGTDALPRAVDYFHRSLTRELGKANLSYNDLAFFAKAEVLRRIGIILDLSINEDNIVWNNVLPIQINSLREIDFLFKQSG